MDQWEDWRLRRRDWRNYTGWKMSRRRRMVDWRESIKRWASPKLWVLHRNRNHNVRPCSRPELFPQQLGFVIVDLFIYVSGDPKLTTCRCFFLSNGEVGLELSIIFSDFCVGDCFTSSANTPGGHHLTSEGFNLSAMALFGHEKRWLFGIWDTNKTATKT